MRYVPKHKTLLNHTLYKKVGVLERREIRLAEALRAACDTIDSVYQLTPYNRPVIVDTFRRILREHDKRKKYMGKDLTTKE